MKIAVGSDHAGFELKEKVREFLTTRGHEVLDTGTTGTASVDYPDFGYAVGRAVASGEAAVGVVVCGSGIGIAMAANKVPGARAGVATDVFSARLMRQHNDANILALGARITAPALAEAILETFLETPFEGGRHQRRVEKLNHGPDPAPPPTGDTNR
ncbi:MAG: ribose 5-phosphate isomerase B [Acidobacteria bacterium]|nr:ribose 5-phosphate isomerase B [Acidobacteriota bacterium]MCK6682275.1 ribose 5-phosphate isomerase B [Thermoanaerobaculia bacterium]